MFDLKSAFVHYGASSYPLTGLPADYQQIASVDDLRDLAQDVGRITSFTREFKVRHCEREVYALPSGDLVIPERIVAIANGYTITWNRSN